MDSDSNVVSTEKHGSFLNLENLSSPVSTQQDATNDFSSAGTKPFSNARISFEVNLQPEKIVEDYKYEDGSHSYRVRWKDTWIHEQLIPAYQSLVDEYWANESLQEKESNVNPSTLPLREEISTQTNAEDDEVQFSATPVDIENSEATKDTFDSLNDLAKSVEENKIEPSSNSSEEKNDDVMQALQPDNLNFAEGQVEKVEEKIDETSSSNNVGESTRLKRKRKSSSILKKYSKKGRGRPKKGKVSEEIQGKENDVSQENDDGDKSKTSDAKGPCTCNICGKVISNKYGLREHQAVVHFKNGKFQCEICGKRVTNKRALNLHMTSHSNERSFVCTQCGSSHKTKGNLNYHIKTMHELVKNFRCDLCFKTFKVQADLKDHCFTAHSNAGIITCIVCKKKLTTALSIYTHSVMHSGAREYECDICGYAFKTLTGLKEHKITHLETKPIRNCPYCERKFYSRSQYNAHVMRHTADGSLITFKCPICDVKFQHKSSYNRHVIRHQPGGDLEFPKENPYLLVDESELPDGVCHKCRKYYASKSGFYLHLKKCRDGIVQQFQCPYCERGCSNRSSLKRHVERRHKGMPFEGQNVQPREIIQETPQTLEVAQQPTSVITPEDGIQFQTSYFDHGYGNQIGNVNANQLSTVDVQLLIDGSADNQQSETTANILGNVGQVTQIGPSGEATQNLHILTESEAAELAAQLSQHGVIVRSSGEGLTQTRPEEQQIIVSNAHVDSRTGQLFVSHSQAAEILVTAQAIRGGSHLNTVDSTTITLQNNQDALLRGDAILQFENRPAVIQLHSGTNEITNQQVISIQNQSLQGSGELPAQPVNTIDSTYTNENMHANSVLNETRLNVNDPLNGNSITGNAVTMETSIEDGNTSNSQGNESESNPQNENISEHIADHEIVLNELREETGDVSSNVILL